MIPIITNILNEPPKNIINHDLTLRIIRDDMIYRYTTECITHQNNDVILNQRCEELRKEIQNIFEIDSKEYATKNRQGH